MPGKQEQEGVAWWIGFAKKYNLSTEALTELVDKRAQFRSDREFAKWLGNGDAQPPRRMSDLLADYNEKRRQRKAGAAKLEQPAPAKPKQTRTKAAKPVIDLTQPADDDGVTWEIPT